MGKTKTFCEQRTKQPKYCIIRIGSCVPFPVAVCCRKEELMNQIAGGAQGNAHERRTYTVEEIAEILNIGRTSAYGLVKEGHFKIVRVGNAIRISKRSFDEWLDAKSL